MEKYVEILQRSARPMQPIATDVAPRLSTLSGIRAVLFDIYGTLFLSASGDVGTVASARADAFVDACRAVELELSAPGQTGTATLVATIEAFHQEARDRGCQYPEVDIVAVWRRTIEELVSQQSLTGRVEHVDFRALAIEYEVRVNPVWPMPGLAECLKRLRTADLHLGIVSNAQFFTTLLFPAFLKQSLAESGFSPALNVLSYQHGQAKPGLHVFEQAKESLARRSISPGEVLYIGNDMLNDVMPAQTVGFRTALFAGDLRSLRKREGDARVARIEPDFVVTHLSQLPTALGLNDLARE